MIFTQEQIDEINQRLANRGIRDSEISKIDLDVNPMTGEETVVIIKDGESVRISIKDFFQQEVANLIEDLDIIRSNASEGKIARENQCIIKTDKNTAYFDNAGNNPNDQSNATLLGAENTATGHGAFAGGFHCEVGEWAAAFNTFNKATGINAFAQGDRTEAAGDASHAEGCGTKALANCSHAEGMETGTTNIGEHACGICNASNTGHDDADCTIFSVGIGKPTKYKRNGLEVRQNGDIYLWLNNSYVRLQDILNRIGGTYAATVAEEELNTIVDDYLDKEEE